MINRLIQEHITGISTDKKKVLIGGVVELLTSIAEEMEQMVRKINELEEKVQNLEINVDNRYK